MLESLTFNHGVGGSRPAGLANNFKDLGTISDCQEEGKTVWGSVWGAIRNAAGERLGWLVLIPANIL